MNITLLLICRLDTVCACALVRLLVISWSWCGSQSDRWSVSFTVSVRMCSRIKMVFALMLFIISLGWRRCQRVDACA